MILIIKEKGRSLWERFVLWSIAKLRMDVMVIPSEISGLMPLVEKLVSDADLKYTSGQSGEYKRDRVYEQLLNTYPQVRPKYLYLAILAERMKHV